MEQIESGENVTGLFFNPQFTKDNIIETPEPDEDTAPDQEELELHEGDHPAIKFFDFTIAATVPICEKANIAPPDKNTYEKFGRTCINEAAWNYLPVGEGESPKWLSLLLAVGCLLIIFSPTALSLLEKQKTHAEIGEAQPKPEMPKMADELTGTEDTETPRTVSYEMDDPSLIA